MQRYSKLEMMTARLLGACPLLKAFVKRGYYIFCRLFFYKPYKTRLFCPDIELAEANTEGLTSTFFGYYDKSPWNSSQQVMAFHGIDYPSYRLPDPYKPVSILVADGDMSRPRKIGSSLAWNWQQGSRLCWIDDKKLIFNDYQPDEDKYVARILNVENQTISTVPYSVNDVYKDLFGLTLNYDRLARIRPDYGYRNRPDAVRQIKPVDEEDGIWHVDLQNNKGKLIISLEQLSRFESSDSMKNAWHKVNHIMISPAGNKFIFLHRWLEAGRTHTRLVLSALNGQDMQVLLDEDMVSHCWWLNNDTILCWARYRGLDNYHLIDIKNERIQCFGEFTLLGDGHPSVCLANGYIISDTYPDRSGMRALLCGNITQGKFVKLADFYESLKFSGQCRCDLHPRWSPDGTMVSVDTVNSGQRRLALIRNISEKNINLR